MGIPSVASPNQESEKHRLENPAWNPLEKVYVVSVYLGDKIQGPSCRQQKRRKPPSLALFYPILRPIQGGLKWRTGA